MALTVTEILAPTTAAATSTVFEVGDKPVTVIAKCDDPIDSNYNAVLQSEGGTEFVNVIERGKVVVLGDIFDRGHQLCITAPGEYRIAKGASTQAIGFETRTPA